MQRPWLGPTLRPEKPHPLPGRPYAGLVWARRRGASGRGRRYSAYDVAKLRYVQHLSQDEGVNLAGIRHILALQSDVEDLRKRVNQLLAEVQRGVGASRRSTTGSRVFSAGPAKAETIFSPTASVYNGAVTIIFS